MPRSVAIARWLGGICLLVIAHPTNNEVAQECHAGALPGRTIIVLSRCAGVQRTATHAPEESGRGITVDHRAAVSVLALPTVASVRRNSGRGAASTRTTFLPVTGDVGSLSTTARLGCACHPRTKGRFPSRASALHCFPWDLAWRARAKPGCGAFCAQLGVCS